MSAGADSFDSLGLSPAVREQFTQATELIQRRDFVGLAVRAQNGEFEAFRAEARRMLEAYSAGLASGSEQPATPGCATFAGCMTGSAAFLGATLALLGRVYPMITAVGVPAKLSNWSLLIGGEIGYVLIAYNTLPACIAASVDPSCGPGAQAAAAVAIAAMVIEWSLIFPINIVIFICNIAGC